MFLALFPLRISVVGFPPLAMPLNSCHCYKPNRHTILYTRQARCPEPFTSRTHGQSRRMPWSQCARVNWNWSVNREQWREIKHERSEKPSGDLSMSVNFYADVKNIITDVIEPEFGSGFCCLLLYSTRPPGISAGSCSFSIIVQNLGFFGMALQCCQDRAVSTPARDNGNQPSRE